MFYLTEYESCLLGIPLGLSNKPSIRISGGLACGKRTLMCSLSYRKLENVAVVENTGHSVANIANTPTVSSFFCNDRNQDLPTAMVLLQGVDALDKCNKKGLDFSGTWAITMKRDPNLAIVSSRTVIAGNSPGLKKKTSYLILQTNAVLREYSLRIRRFVLHGLLSDDSFPWASLILYDLQ